MASVKRDHHKFNILVIGDTMAGKSALVKRYVHGKFDIDNSSTIGVEYEGKTIIDYPKCDVDLRLALWDASGQKAFVNIIKSYFRMTNGVILVVDLSKRNSYNNLHRWLTEIEVLMKKMIPVLVVGNKNDLAEKRVVSTEEMFRFVGEYKNLDYIETSALTGKNVGNAFEQLVINILRHNGKYQNLELELAKKNSGCNSGYNIKRYFCCF